MIKEMRKKNLRRAVLSALWFIFAPVYALLSICGIVDSRFPIGVHIFMVIISVGSIALEARKVLSTKYMQGIEDFCNKAHYPDQVMNRIRHTWANGVVATDHCRMDNEYFVFLDGKVSAVFPWDDVHEVCTAIIYQPGHSRSFTLQGKFIFGDSTVRTLPIAVKTNMKAAEEKLRATEGEVYALLTKHHPAIRQKSEPKIVKKALA